MDAFHGHWESVRDSYHGCFPWAVGKPASAKSWKQSALSYGPAVKAKAVLVVLVVVVLAAVVVVLVVIIAVVAAEIQRSSLFTMDAYY